jgi:hypothetical protein
MSTTTIYLVDTENGVEFHMTGPDTMTNSLRLGLQIKTFIDTLAAQVNAPIQEIKSEDDHSR